MLKINKNYAELTGVLLLLLRTAWAQPGAPLSGVAQPVGQARPLDQLVITGAQGRAVAVADGAGKVYFQRSAKPQLAFTVGGALGTHTVYAVEADGKKTVLSRFRVTARTDIDDHGPYKQLFEMSRNGLILKNDETGAEERSVTWNGRTYRHFVPWILDHGHTMRGAKYFYGYGAEFLDVLKASQRDDGMIYSFIQYMPNADYFLTRDKWSGYSQRLGDKVFVRQPTENHPEYMYVNTIYQAWKSTGDDAWMKTFLASAAKALDYTVGDPARWSKRFQLLKRVYTIDSWDFAVDDEYLPNLGITNTMVVHPDKSKFGVFFGDNTGYIAACGELAEMFARAGNAPEAERFRQRGAELKARLDKLAWNGKFYRHFIEEDPTVVRKLGVDEASQIAQSNAYSLNRPLDPAQRRAILETYRNLQRHLPPGSPGEFYAIYPPFERGFGTHNDRWQYMNGGVGAHTAGELARGAFEAGYEAYGADILDRLLALGQKYDNKLYFAYTGASMPPPPAPTFRPLDLTAQANMDFWVRGDGGSEPWMRGKRAGDDLRNLPTGEQAFSGVRFRIIDPERNARKAVVAVSRQAGLPAQVEIPVGDTAACVYLLHTSSKPASENVVGSVAFVYADGSQKIQYLLNDKHLTYWWFSKLKTDHSGIAWYGKNEVSEGVGLSWCALNNPEPAKKISKLVFKAPESDGIYTLFGLTLADRPHEVPVKGPSYGGPDNWSAALVMAALIEGLAGVQDAPGAEAFSKPLVAPRWVVSRSDTLAVTVNYPASEGYLAYRFLHDKKARQLRLTTTGSGKALVYHVLLPTGVGAVRSFSVNGKASPFKLATVEKSAYLDADLPNNGPQEVVIQY